MKGSNVNAIVARAAGSVWRKRIFVILMAALTILIQIFLLALSQWLFPNDAAAFRSMTILSFAWCGNWLMLAVGLGGSMKEITMTCWVVGFGVVFSLWAAILDTRRNLLIWVIVLDWIYFVLEVIAFIAIILFFLTMKRLRRLLVRVNEKRDAKQDRRDVFWARALLVAAQMD